MYICVLEALINIDSESGTCTCTYNVPRAVYCCYSPSTGNQGLYDNYNKPTVAVLKAIICDEKVIDFVFYNCAISSQGCSYCRPLFTEFKLVS